MMERCYRWLASLFIAGILLAQAATIPFTAVRNDRLAARLYPILAYDMYRETHRDGERVDASWLLEGVDATGRTFPITSDMLKVSIWDWKRILQFAAQGDQTSGVVPLKELVSANAPGAAAYVELRVKSLPVRVTRNGPQTMESEVLNRIPMNGTK